MPITGPSSYVPTAEEFDQHWATADASLGPGNEITLPDGAIQAGLTAKKDQLADKRAELQGKLNNKEIARGDVNIKKAALLERVVQFNDKVRAFFPGSKWLNALPAAPGLSEAQSKFIDPLEDAANLWQQINADPATSSPVTLLGGYDQAAFVADIAGLKTAYTTLNAAGTTLKVTRQERNDLQDELYGMLKSYRQVLPTFFAKDHAIVESLPRLTPLPGSTPKAVNVSAVWDEAAVMARITWNESDDPNLNQYQVRFVPGADYNTDDEASVAAVDPGQPLEVLTDAGLTQPGAVSSFKVYVLATTGNEKGSAAVTVTRTG